MAVDLRRADSVALENYTWERLRDPSAGSIPLEDWGPGSESCIWAFNELFWSALDLWERTTGHSYEEALPGGESDGNNRAAARDLILDLFARWDSLATTGDLPEELWIVELGSGSGNQAKVFLDEFRSLDNYQQRGYYRRLHYVMGDCSPQVLDTALTTVADHIQNVYAVVLDATRPSASLTSLTKKAFLVYVSNLYDNLPTDELAQINGRSHMVQTRAYLPQAGVAKLADSIGASKPEIRDLALKLMDTGPDRLACTHPIYFSDTDSAVVFWQELWSHLRVAERYIPLDTLDAYAVTPTMSGEILAPLLCSGEDIRMHVNNSAVRSLVDSLELLHPLGKLVSHDLFVTDLEGYRSKFRGPGKYDGSVVNWVNGALLAQAAHHCGAHVSFEPFRYREEANITTMTAVRAEC